MSKFCALLVSSLVAVTVLAGAPVLDGAEAAPAKAPSARNTDWCC